MKISELMQSLAALRERHGDLEVHAQTDDGRGQILVTRARFHATRMNDDPLELPIVALDTSETDGWDPADWEEGDQKQFLLYMAEWNQNEIVGASFFHRYDWTRCTWLCYPQDGRFLRRLSTWQPPPIGADAHLERNK